MELLGLLILVLSLLFLRCGASPLSDDASALMAFRRAIFEDPHSVLSDWGRLEDDPCRWYGVGCSLQTRVISLKLSNSSLKGFIAPELGQLSSLQELYLDNNLLLGTIPKQIGMLKSLRVLDLSSNRLTGVIPSELGELSSINRINLHSNSLTGSIPPELGNLEGLVELRLDRNRLRGAIPGASAAASAASASSGSDRIEPGLCPSSPRLSVGDFSYNFLTGRIPLCLKYLPTSSFQGNCFQDEFSALQRAFALCKGGSTGSQTGGQRQYNAASAQSNRRGFLQPKWLLILEAATGILVLVFLITVAAAAARRCILKPSVKISSCSRSRRWSDEIALSIDGEGLKNVRKLSRQELEVACEDFSNIIGSSSESVLYKGTIKSGPEIAVISLCASEEHWSSQLEFAFQNKVAELAKLSHENVANFFGYCKEAEPFSRMLVFEYASNGTLYEHLHYGEGSQLSWLRRMKIAIGIARGLKYLHTELEPPLAIADLSSFAVYVTEDFTPKLADFSCWKMLYAKRLKSSARWPSNGDLNGYTGPIEHSHADVQCNTFAFGVILLEIISGRPAYCKERGYLVDWALKHLQTPGEIGKLVDPDLASFRADDLVVICSAVSSCIDPDPTKRPSMQIIAGLLENGIDLSAAAMLNQSSLAWAELELDT